MMDICGDRYCLNHDLLASFQCAATLYFQNIYASVARVGCGMTKHHFINTQASHLIVSAAK